MVWAERERLQNLILAGKDYSQQFRPVDFEDITYITSNYERIKFNFMPGPTWTFGIEYLEEGMEAPEFAEILFKHEATADRFWRDLKRACRQCKDRDGVR